MNSHPAAWFFNPSRAAIKIGLYDPRARSRPQRDHHREAARAALDAARSTRRRRVGFGAALVLGALVGTMNTPSQAAGDLPSSGSVRIELIIPPYAVKPNGRPCVLASMTQSGDCTVGGRQWKNVRYEQQAAGAHAADLLLVVAQ